MKQKDDLRFITIVNGELYVMTVSQLQMVMLYAESWGLEELQMWETLYFLLVGNVEVNRMSQRMCYFH